MFSTINCGWDINLFQLGIEFIRQKGFLFALLTNLPSGYNNKFSWGVMDEFHSIARDDYLFICRRDVNYCSYDGESPSFIFGSIEFEGRRIGIVATFFLDYFGESSEIQSIYLPVIMASLLTLLSGGQDRADKIVHKCESVVILGSVTCRDYPMASSIKWPRLSSYFPAELPRTLYGSRIFEISCIPQPFIYDTQHSDMYVPYSSCDNESSVMDKVNSLSKDYSPSSFLPDDLVIHSERTIDERCGSGLLFPFVRAPYETAFYEKWRNSEFLNEEQRPSHDLVFSASWIEVVSVKQNVLSDVLNCSHHSNGLRLNRALVSDTEQLKEDRDLFSVYEVQKSPLSSGDSTYIPKRNHLKNYKELLDVLLDLLEPRVAKGEWLSAEYAAVFFPLDEKIIKPSQCCWSYLTSKAPVTVLPQCAFGVRHEENCLHIRIEKQSI